MLVHGGSTASFLQSTFVGNTIIPDNSGAAIIEAEPSIMNSEVCTHIIAGPCNCDG